jgi:tight adherence protein C
VVAFISACIFLSVGLLAGAVLYPVLEKRNLIRTRVSGLIDIRTGQQTLLPTSNRWQLFLANAGLKIQITPADLSTYRRLVTSAGYRRETVYVFLGSKLFLAAALPALWVVFFVIPNGTPGGNSLLFPVAAAIAGYLLPTFYVEQVAKERKIRIFHSLPDLLDLLTICVEAGLGLDAAFLKAIESTQDRNDPLIKEITIVALEVRAGKPRSEALRGLAERTMVEDVKSFVSMLVQTEKFGTSLSKTLRTYSDSLRMKRKQLAEEKAAKTAVKMLIPLTFCIFPGLLIVMLTPAFFRIYQLFEK